MKTLILVAAMAVNAAAATISYDYTGEVRSTWGADAIPVDDIIGIRTGDLVAGSFTIDLDTPGTPSPNPGNDHVLNYFDAITEFSITVGDVDFLHDLDDVRVVGIINDMQNFDVFGMTSIVTADGNRVIVKAAITDDTGLMFSDLSLGNAVDLPFGNDLLKHFSLLLFGTDTVNITWQTLEMTTPVPEPSTIAMLIVGLLISQYRNVLRWHRPDNRLA